MLCIRSLQGRCYRLRTAFSQVSHLLCTIWESSTYQQVENEYGYCGSDPAYIRRLLGTAKAALGDDVIFYTTDPPTLVAAGSLPGDELYT